MCFSNSTKEVSNPIPDENFGSEAVDYNGMQTLFNQIENKLTNLTNIDIEKPSPILQPITSFQSYNEETLFNIVDYSPEWDYTKGGTKVIICVNPLCLVAEAVNNKLKVYFGESSVPGYFIQPGVIKCYGISLYF